MMLRMFILSVVLYSVCQGAALNAVDVSDPTVLIWAQSGSSVHNGSVGNCSDSWCRFMKEHGRKYASPEEESVRKLIFNENLKKIEAHNYLHSKGHKSWTMAINKFADMTADEFSQKMNGFKMDDSKKAAMRSGKLNKEPRVKIENLPEEVDWRLKGHVTPVKDQGWCGSCWAFSVTGAVEGQFYKRTGQLVTLSEQNLVDCARSYGTWGCNGGYMDPAFQYIIDNGINSEKVYPYNGTDMRCTFNKRLIGANISTFVDVLPYGDEEVLQEVVATVGPIAVAIDAWGLQFYHSGIYDDEECTEYWLNHAVLLVGYGTMDRKDYWLVKNSWGYYWGELGYILMSRNKNNQCGIATAASFPL